MGKRRLKIGGSEPSANYEIKNKNCKIKYMIKWRKKMFQYFLCSAIMSLDGPATNFYPTFCYICPMKFLQQTFIGYQTFLNKIMDMRLFYLYWSFFYSLTTGILVLKSNWHFWIRVLSAGVIGYSILD